MKPILLVITELEVGGAEKALVEIALRLSPHGLLPTVVSLRPRPAAGRDALVKKLEADGIPVRFLDVTRATQVFRALGRLRKLLRECQASVVLSFLFHANVVTALATRNRPIRHFAGIRVAEPSGWRNRLEAWALRNGAGVICVSEGVKRHFSRYFSKAPKLAVIPNGVANTTPVAAADLSTIGISATDKVLLFVGRLHPQKGLDWALPAIGGFLSNAPQVHFVIIGDGPQRDELEKAALQNPWAERVHFLGFQNEIASFVARATCLLLPSRWEGMPNVVLEAMAAGKPVLASSESNASELLSGAHVAEQLFDFGDEGSLVDKLSALFADEELATRLGSANRARCDKFSWDVVVAEYMRRFSEAV